MKAGQSEPGRKLRAAVLLFFVTSGATSLVLEVAWTRILGTVFGNTVYAASTVLTAFMFGLAAGGVMLGRVADRSQRPLVLYGCLELGVGVYAALFPLLADASSTLYGWVFRLGEGGPVLLNAVRFGLSLLLLLPATFLMGGTLPVLGRYLAAAHREPGREVGYLYGANTAGAVAGSFLSGFVLLEALGIRGTLLAAGGVAAAVGLLAIALGRRAAEPAKPLARPKARRTEPVAPVAGATFRLVLIAFAITGFCALAYEVLWTRVLIFVLTTTVYSFVTMLTSFLAGLAIGSFVSSRFLVPRLRRPMLWFGAIEVLIALSALASVALLARLERIDAWLSPYFIWGGLWRIVLVRFADVFVVLFVPTLLMGAAFPIVTTCCLRGGGAVGQRVGQLYAANTIGCVLGSAAAGFLLLPALGTHVSLLVVVAINLAVGVALVWGGGAGTVRARFGLALPLGAIVVAAFLVTPSDVFYSTINTYHNPSKIIFIKEHTTGTVTVHDLPNGDRLLSVDGIDVAGLDFMLRSTQKLQGYIPLCLHPSPRRVVQIGFGSGETARVGLEFGVSEYTVVEICPAIFDAGRFFEAINHGSYQDPRVRRVIMDGKNFARLSGEKFDVVMNDSTYPGSSGSSALYTVDHFRNCRERLAEGGLLSSWVPFDLRPSELRMILQSFQQVFPHTSFWMATNCVNKHALILGSLSPLRVDLARLQAVVSRPDIAADLKGIAINDAYDLLDCHICDEDAIRELVKSDPVNSDDRPRLEFSCAIPVPQEGSLGYVLAMLAACHSPVAPYVGNFGNEARDRAELARRFRATDHILQAQVAQLTGHPKARERQLDLAREANLGEAHVESCEAELQREIRDLQAALADRPGNQALMLRLADKLFAASRHAEAAQLYEPLVSLGTPPPDWAFVRLAEIRYWSGDAASAESLLVRCLALWPRSAEAHDRLAAVCLRSGRLDQAQQHIAQAVRLAPWNPLYQAHQKQITAATR